MPRCSSAGAALHHATAPAPCPGAAPCTVQVLALTWEWHPATTTHHPHIQTHPAPRLPGQVKGDALVLYQAPGQHFHLSDWEALDNVIFDELLGGSWAGR